MRELEWAEGNHKMDVGREMAGRLPVGHNETGELKPGLIQRLAYLANIQLAGAGIEQ